MHRLIFVLTWALLTFQNVGYAYDGRFTLAAENGLPALQRIHPPGTYAADAEAAASLEHWRTQPTGKILDSLKPGNPESLRTWPDGRMVNGNTRTLVLEERGVPINNLPREVKITDPNTGSTTWVNKP